MSKKIITSILIPAFLLQVFGCYSVNEVPRNEISEHNGAIEGIILTNGTEIKFDVFGGRYLSSRQKIIGNSETGNYINVNLEDVASLEYEEKDIPKTIVVVALFGLLILYAIYQLSQAHLSIY